MSAAEKTTDEAGEPSWDLSFSAVELKESASLGGDVRIEIAPRTTVLVGKNGAGKSLLLERMFEAIREASGGAHIGQPDPARFECEIEVESVHPSGRIFALHYECRWRLREREPESSGAAELDLTIASDFQVEESCWIRGDEKEVLWRVEDGVISNRSGFHSVTFTGTTLLSWAISRGRREVFVSEMAYPVASLFFSLDRVPAGIPRGDSEREELALTYPRPSQRRDAVESRRTRGLAYSLVDWHEKARERFDEFVEVGRRIGLFDEVKVKLYRDPDANRGERSLDFASIRFDGTDFGLLSDGTLRIVEILMRLISPGVKLLLIEEPETAVHPGLLKKLLAEIDAYSIDRQIILTTQSPIVVTWTKQNALRLVERHAGKTSVRSLREDEISRVAAYLNDEGTLGDFVYSGALDG